MSDRPHYDSALFWLPFGAAASVIGLALMTIAINRLSAGANLLNSAWFDGGIGLLLAGAVIMVWALSLFLAHRHISAHQSKGAVAETRAHVVTTPAQSNTSAPEHPHGNLARDLQTVPDFNVELERITGHRPTRQMTEEDTITRDVSRLAAERLGDIPLRSAEMLAVVHVLREAISNVDDSPFEHNNEAQDITTTGEVRDDRMWQMQLTTAKAYYQGIIRSDGTYATLRDLYVRLNQLRKEVHRRYHPPSMPTPDP